MIGQDLAENFLLELPMSRFFWVSVFFGKIIKQIVFLTIEGAWLKNLKSLTLGGTK